MAVTITTNTLSARVRYLNVSGSSANADAKDIVLAMANALIELGWTRHDTAGETAVVGTNDNAGVILRRAMHDHAQSGHFNYLGLRLVGTNNNTYTFHLIQAADWSSTTSMTAFVNAATSSSYAPNLNGRTRFLNFEQGGTVWMFDSGRTLLLTSQSGEALTKDAENTWLVSEYKKEFGENVDSATGYIHNGVFTNDRWLLTGYGAEITTTFREHIISRIGFFGGSSTGFAHWRTQGPGLTDAQANYASATAGSRFFVTASGRAYGQFTLTEAPSLGNVAQNSSTLTRAVVAPTATGVGFSTRLLMGYLGYIGHLNYMHLTSVMAELVGINGPTSTQFKYPDPPANLRMTGATTNLAGQTNLADSISNLFTYRGNFFYPIINNVQEFSPATLATNLKFTVFEPTLSCGTSNGITSITAPSSNTYSGPQYKFSMLGRMFDVKIFGPFTNEKYTFLDSITIPCNSDGFYDENGTDKEFWISPCGNNMALVMPK